MFSELGLDQRGIRAREEQPMASLDTKESPLAPANLPSVFPLRLRAFA